MRLLHLLFAAAAAFSPAVQSQDDPQYLNWECPGMPCFIVNIFEYRPYSKLSQTCTFIDDHTMCTDLETGKSFDTGNSTVTQHHTVTRTHPCQDYWGCHQLECSQGSLAQCHTICDNLQLLPLYNTTCYDYCGSSTGCK